jgi:uncharacterized protein YggE
MTTVKFSTAPTISIEGTGVTYGDFDAANYSLTVKGKGRTGPKAKAAVREIQKHLFGALEMLRAEGVTFVPGKTRSTLSVDKDYNASRFFAGYVATFSMTFRSRDLDRLAEIHDTLTSIEGAEVASPYFVLDPEAKEDLHRSAFQRAVTQANNRFADQCKLLGFDPADYEVASWSSRTGRDTHSNFKALSNFSPTSNDEDFFIPVGDGRASVESGESKVQVHLTLNFTRKGSA